MKSKLVITRIKAKTLVFAAVIALTGCDDNFITPPPEIPVQPQDRTPAWSPDGGWIAYFHFNLAPDTNQYSTGLYLTDVLGKQRNQIIKGFAYNPDWSPDGGRIVFDRGDIFVIRINDASTIQLTYGAAHNFPSWSPDGSKIAYDIAINDSAGIWIMNNDGTDKRRLWPGRNPDWAFDSKYLVYEGVGGIWKGEVDSSNFSILANGEEGFRDPQWSPDGLKIAWMIGRGGGEIWVMEADGSNQYKLVDGVEPSWSPDSEKIVFARAVQPLGKMVLWIIHIDGTNLRQLTN